MLERLGQEIAMLYGMLFTLEKNIMTETGDEFFNTKFGD
jgi:hypothetical protein